VSLSYTAWNKSPLRTRQFIYDPFPAHLSANTLSPSALSDDAAGALHFGAVRCLRSRIALFLPAHCTDLTAD
jgi:hypothetical protein